MNYSCFAMVCHQNIHIIITQIIQNNGLGLKTDILYLYDAICIGK